MQVAFQFDDQQVAQGDAMESQLALSDIEKIVANKEKFVNELTREVNRVERLKWNAYRKTGRRSSSVARVNQAKLAEDFDLSSAGYSDLDYIIGQVTLNLPMKSKANYHNDVSSAVEAYISRNSNKRPEASL